MKKSQKRIHRVNRALFLSLSNVFEEEKLIPKIFPKKFLGAPCFPKIVCGGQCAGVISGVATPAPCWREIPGDGDGSPGVPDHLLIDEGKGHVVISLWSQ